MSTLTAKQRSKLKASQFAGPHDSYPINDRTHAANALARAAQQYKAGKLTKDQYDKIVARARAALKRFGGGK